MTRLALATLLTLAQTPAQAELVVSGSDTIEVRGSSQAGVHAEVEYSNGVSKGSHRLRHVFEFEGVKVQVRIEVGGREVENAEIITVEVLDGGLIAYPPEAHVPDGQSVVIQIMRPMF